jgi:hypothetical protein
MHYRGSEGPACDSMRRRQYLLQLPPDPKPIFGLLRSGAASLRANCSSRPDRSAEAAIAPTGARTTCFSTAEPTQKTRGWYQLV